MNSQIDIDSIGESDEQALVCHTDSPVCCRGMDNPNGFTGSGEWLFPNGTTIVRSQDVTVSDTDLFYRSRDTQLIRLHRRGNITMPTGTYCCIVPVASGGDKTFCVELGELRKLL